MRQKAQILDEAGLNRALMRISHEILEHNRGAENLRLIGVRRRGEPIAGQIRDNIRRIEGKEVPVGSIDIAFYRDDLSRLGEMPQLRRTELPFDVTDRDVVLFDDVIYTGRTARAAIEAVFACGRPRTIQLAVLVDRGHRDLRIPWISRGWSPAPYHGSRAMTRSPSPGKSGLHASGEGERVIDPEPW